jgi:FMN-dependent NADH-azoreductase
LVFYHDEERNVEKVAKVLYITANPKTEAESYSLSVAREFFNTYRQVNLNDEIIELDLYKMDIQRMGQTATRKGIRGID